MRHSAIAERARLQAEWAELKNSGTLDVLRGVVVLVDVGEGSKGIALRAALAGLGATVVLEWSPIVTHVVWTPEGSRKIRAAARSLAARLVSPLWVSSCAAAARRLPARAFPTGARASDLPSPRALRHLLRNAEKENVTLGILSDTTNFKINTQEKTTVKPVAEQKLRISSENDTSTDRSDDTSTDQSRDRSILPSRVNTAPRRALPASIGTPDKIQKKSKRKLFTYKEAEVVGSSSEDEEVAKVSVRKPSLPSQRTKPKPAKIKMAANTQLSHQTRKDLARAERMARRLAATPKKTCTQGAPRKNRIVLTGMSRSERLSVCDAVRQLNGKIQKDVDRRTTHVILGSCREDARNNLLEDITGVQPFYDISCSERNVNYTKATYGDTENFPTVTGLTKDNGKDKARTQRALEGAARGCHVVGCNWALESAKDRKWLDPWKYEIPHLRKLSQKARIERSALGLNNREYAYNVFNGTKVHITPSAARAQAVGALVRLCGGVVGEGGVAVGGETGQVEEKWVFDSVAAGRMRTRRRYVVH